MPTKFNHFAAAATIILVATSLKAQTSQPTPTPDGDADHMHHLLYGFLEQRERNKAEDQARLANEAQENKDNYDRNQRTVADLLQWLDECKQNSGSTFHFQLQPGKNGDLYIITSLKGGSDAPGQKKGRLTVVVADNHMQLCSYDDGTLWWNLDGPSPLEDATDMQARARLFLHIVDQLNGKKFEALEAPEAYKANQNIAADFLRGLGYLKRDFAPKFDYQVHEGGEGSLYIVTNVPEAVAFGQGKGDLALVISDNHVDVCVDNKDAMWWEGESPAPLKDAGDKADRDDIFRYIVGTAYDQKLTMFTPK